MKVLLILGCQRSGTSLLASMLGRHKEINMLYESITDDTFKLIGKEYQGNKLLLPRQIHFTKRASKFGYLINRIINFHFRGYKYQKVRIYPSSKLSITDYLSRGAKLIVMTREKEATINSMIKRAGLSPSQAEREYTQAMNLIQKLIQEGAFHVRFEDLLIETETVLKNICNFLDLEYDKRMLEGPKYNFVYPNDRIVKEKAITSNKKT
ncbi:MAG: sulfotransferase [Ignavibacteria bacterium]|nr:MAG: sulfotransferase [Ignavibacteria bacterium]